MISCKLMKEQHWTGDPVTEFSNWTWRCSDYIWSRQSRRRKTEGWGRVSVNPTVSYFTVKVCESVFSLWTERKEMFEWNQQFDSPEVTKSWTAEKLTGNLQENNCVCVCVCVLLPVLCLVCLLNLCLLILVLWAHSQCFCFSDWLKSTRWMFVRRKRRTEQSLQCPAVRRWRVTGPKILIYSSVMNLDPQTQSKRTATSCFFIQQL